MSSTPKAINLVEETEEVLFVVPDQEKLLSDMKAFMSHHAMATALEKKRLKEKEDELKEAQEKIKTLNKDLDDLNKRLKGAEHYLKQNLNLQKSNEDLLNRLQVANARISEFEATEKEAKDNIYTLEQQVEKLSEFKQKVELAQVLFNGSIKDVEMNAEETHMNVSLGHPSAQDDSFSVKTGTAKRGKMSHRNRSSGNPNPNSNTKKNA